MAAFFGNLRGFLRYDLPLTFRSSLPLSLLLLGLIPAIRGVSNLDPARSAQCLSQSVSLLGVILFTPLTRWELDPGIREALSPKPWTYSRTVMIRLLCAFALLFLLIGSFALVMRINSCQFPFGAYVLAALLYAAFLGTLGLLAAQLGNHTAIGYLPPLGYWSLCQLQVIREGDPLYVFPIVAGDMDPPRLALLLVLLTVFTGGIMASSGFPNASLPLHARLRKRR